MTLKMFSLLDIKTGIFNTPFFMAHAGQAIRACIDLGQDMATTVARHPADFMLVDLGTFDDQTGTVATGVPLQLGTVASFLPAPQPAADLFYQRVAERTGVAEPSPELARQVEHQPNGRA